MTTAVYFIVGKPKLFWCHYIVFFFFADFSRTQSLNRDSAEMKKGIVIVEKKMEL